MSEMKTYPITRLPQAIEQASDPSCAEPAYVKRIKGILERHGAKKV